MKTTYKYDHYFTQSERKEMIEFFVSKYPNLISSEVLMTTTEGREQFALTLTNFKTGKPEDKAAFYIDANTHAGEVTGMVCAMHTVDYLLTNYKKDKDVKFMLDTFVFYVIPSVSPDGSDTYLLTPYMLRSVNKDYKKEDHGLFQQDMDHDGAIRMMRVKDPYGKFKIDPENEDLMLAREADEMFGDFYNIYTEGEIVGYDGVNVEIARAAWAMDFNRNYPFGWFPDFRQPGAGPYPLAYPETKAVVDFVQSHNNICSVLTHHTSGGVLLTPPGTYSSKKAPAFDMNVYKTLGSFSMKTLGYKDLNIFDGFMTDQENYDSGAFDDFCYETRGVYATTMELWDLEERSKEPNNWGNRDQLAGQCQRIKACYNWLKANDPDFDYKKWTKFKHPQLGEVEIGGFDIKKSFQNPPVAFLNEVAEKCTQFTMSYASILPRIEVVSVKNENVGDDVYKCEIVVGNLGYLPTYISEKALQRGINTGVNVSINAKTVEGPACVNIGELAGFANIKATAMYHGNYSTLKSEPCKKKISFVYKAPKNKKVSIKIFGDKINTITQAI